MKESLEIIAECYYQVKISPLDVIRVYDTPTNIPGCKRFTHVILESTEKQRIHRYYLDGDPISLQDAMPILDLIN